MYYTWGITPYNQQENTMQEQIKTVIGVTTSLQPSGEAEIATRNSLALQVSLLCQLGIEVTLVPAPYKCDPDREVPMLVFNRMTAETADAVVKQAGGASNLAAYATGIEPVSMLLLDDLAKLVTGARFSWGAQLVRGFKDDGCEFITTDMHQDGTLKIESSIAK